jgi:protein-L-isoaspartate(D-aspartate) O-methyltransferase
MLGGAQREAARSALAACWDDPDPALRRHARRFSAEDLIGEAERALPADPGAAERLRMVRDQLFHQGLSDPRVLRAMLETPRERFVPDPRRSQAYDPAPLPIGEDQTISQPYIVGFMTEALDLRGGERVLEIGTGSGYQTAVLARLAREVFSVEIRGTLSRRAGSLLAQLGHANIRLRTADGHAGWPEAAPFDGVIVTCAPAEVPARLTDQLREGGRLVIPVGESPERQDLVRVTRDRAGLREERLIAVRFVPMTGREAPGTAP